MDYRKTLMFLVAAWAAVLLPAITQAEGSAVVVSNTYENLDAKQAVVDKPVTFSRIGIEGDFTKGITPSIDGKKLPAQVNVLRKAPDGSIRHALVTFVIDDGSWKIKNYDCDQ